MRKHLPFIACLAFAVCSISGVHADNNVPYSFYYPKKPDATSASDMPVGSPNGTFVVNATGGAQYLLGIEVPKGLGAMQPNVGIVYSSQSGNGIVGYGCNVSGISAITHCAKDILHDGAAYGIRHETNNAYSLDGKRLMLESGTEGAEGAVYGLEGDPFTKITLHGTANGAGMWFEARTRDGVTYEYGHGDSHQQNYVANNSTRTNVWYIGRAEDACGNYMTFQYTASHNFVYPWLIEYGMNSAAGDTPTASVEFSYEDLPSGYSSYYIAGVEFSMRKRLAKVQVRASGQLFRKYAFSYQEDAGTGFSKLARIVETNAEGEALNPVTLEWNDFPTGDVEVANPSLNIATGNHFEVFNGKEVYFCADLTGDGLSDFVEFVPVKHYISDYFYTLRTFAYINKARMGDDGGTSFEYTPIVCTFPPSFSMPDMCSTKTGAPLVGDIDGDGIQDMIVPDNHISQLEGWRYGELYFCPGKSIKETTSYSEHQAALHYTLNLKSASDEVPLCVCADFDNDGRAEVLMMEKGSIGDRRYPCSIISYKGGAEGAGLDGDHLHSADFSLFSPSAPLSLFAGDFDCDGLVDIIVFHKTGYTVFWNKGGAAHSSRFGDESEAVGSNIWDVNQILQGDFNGDGAVDFLLNEKNDPNWYFAISTANGKFKKLSACSLDVYDQSTGNDDDKFKCLVYDIDHDGKSDVFINKALYGTTTFTKNKFSQTKSYWLKSTGSALEVMNVATSTKDSDGYAGHYMVGDFNGDGSMELMNHGYDCYNGNNANEEGLTHIYYSPTFSANSGKVSAVTDGMGNTTSVAYSPLTNSGIYTTGASGRYPVLSCSLPLHVVRETVSSNGVADDVTETYAYERLLAHVRGRGLIGFENVVTTNPATGVIRSSRMEQMDTIFYVPTITCQTLWKDGNASTERSVLTVAPHGDRNYYISGQGEQKVSWDGEFDERWQERDALGRVTSETVGLMMYQKTTDYADFAYIKGMYLPQAVTTSEICDVDDTPFVCQTRIAYDAQGNKSSVTEHHGTSKAVTTLYGYDLYGNVVSRKSTGEGVPDITYLTEYDPTGRFVTRTFSSPAINECTYTYDTWGNLTEETDNRISSTASIVHTYDGWGRRIATAGPSSLKSTTITGWGTSAGKRYFVLEQGSGRPWVKTWYDARDRKVLEESVGAKDISVTVAYAYDGQGRLSSKTSTEGDLSHAEAYAYDSLDRLVQVTGSDGRSKSYAYAPYQVTETENGHSVDKYRDGRGNPLVVEDSQTSALYVYHPTGQPMQVFVNDVDQVQAEYDEAGNQTSLHDACSGTTLYEYDAAGHLVCQTSPRGVVSREAYDSLGRLTAHIVGSDTTTYEYGTDGPGLMRLAKEEKDGKRRRYTYRANGQPLLKSSLEGLPVIEMFSYDSYDRVSKHSYTFSPQATYTYDLYGNPKTMAVGGKTLWELEGYTGSTVTCRFGGQLRKRDTYDSSGRLTGRQILKGDTVLHAQAFAYDTRDNLVQRTGPSGTEGFTYDEYDRLLTATGQHPLTMAYDAGGDITSKTGLGAYGYDGSRLHAVTSVENPGGLVPDREQEITYNGFDKVLTIEEGPLSTMFTYGTREQRTKAVTTVDGEETCTVLYHDVLDKVSKKDTVSYFVYLDHDIVAVKQYVYRYGSLKSTTQSYYYAVKDNVGSIVALVDTLGNTVFEAGYDAWGKQTVTKNDIGFIRGYTGHEMMPGYGLVNMNGRLYDPELGRFLSPDNYVQMPDNPQNFNRYSYCLNNPLKYNDPSGEFWWIVGAAVVGGILNAGFNIDNINSTGDFLNFFVVGAVAGAVGAVTGGMSIGIGGVVGGVGTGLMSGISSGLILGGGNAWITSGNIWDSALRGALISGISAAFLGGITGGFNSYLKGENIWTGSQETASIIETTSEVIPENNKMVQRFASVDNLKESSIASSSISSTEEINEDVLIHYTSKKGYEAIIKTQELNPSIGYKNARYGDGQYFTNLKPEDYTAGQISRRLYQVPWNSNKIEYHLKIDVKGLNVIQNNPHNFLIPGNKPLNLQNRIVGGGITVFKIKF